MPIVSPTGTPVVSLPSQSPTRGPSITPSREPSVNLRNRIPSNCMLTEYRFTFAFSQGKEICLQTGPQLEMERNFDNYVCVIMHKKKLNKQSF